MRKVPSPQRRREHRDYAEVGKLLSEPLRPLRLCGEANFKRQICKPNLTFLTLPKIELQKDAGYYTSHSAMASRSEVRGSRLGTNSCARNPV
jgi:hypothetical protein